MAKFQSIILAVVLVLATTHAAGTQRRFQRKFARQEVAADVPDVVTPYPSADELKPELPFEEVPAANTPDEVYGPPQVYTPDEVYGPPEVAVNSVVPAESEIVPSEELPFPAEQQQQSARLALARNARLQRLQRQRAAQLKSASYPQKRRF